MKVLEFILILVLIAVIVAGGCAGLRLLQGKDAQIAALHTAAAGQGTRDAAAAGAAEAGCAARVAAAVRAGAAIARLTAPTPRTDPKVQPMYSAGEIREVLQ